MKTFSSIIASALILTALPLQGQNQVRLSDLDASKVSQPYGTPAVGKAVSGEQLKVGGVSYTDGVGVQADSRMKFNLMGNSNSFSCKVGVNDNSVDYSNPDLIKIPLVDGTMIFYTSVEKGKEFRGIGSADGTVGKGSVVFRILGDGKELFNSGVMHGGEPARPVNLEIRGIQTFELIAEDAGDGISGDHADWIDAVFDYFEIKPAPADADAAIGKVETDESILAPLRGKISSLPVRPARC